MDTTQRPILIKVRAAQETYVNFNDIESFVADKELNVTRAYRKNSNGIFAIVGMPIKRLINELSHHVTIIE